MPTARIRPLVHQANNALGAARGHCEIALIEAGGDDRIRRRMDTAIEAIDEVAELLRQIVNPSPQPAGSGRDPRTAPVAEVALLSANPELRQSTRDLLLALGFGVRTAAGPADLGQMFRPGEPEPGLLICDGSTAELGRCFASLPPKLRLLLLGQGSPELPPNRPCAHLEVPFSAEQLRRAVEHLLAQP